MMKQDKSAGVYSNNLFNTIYKENDFRKAQIVAKNLFCKTPDDIDTFRSYFEFCIGLISRDTPLEIHDMKFFLDEAELALRIFAEQCEMTEDTLLCIDACSAALREKYTVLNNRLEEQQRLEAEMLLSQNDKVFSDLCSSINKLHADYSDSLVEEIARFDNELNKDLLTKVQQKRYETYSEKLSQIVTKHLRSINTNYNLTALSDFKKAQETFVSDSIYKKEKGRELLKKLLVNNLFLYAQDKLFPETLIYYNFVYSFIFGKLDNEGKKFMTEIAIQHKK